MLCQDFYLCMNYSYFHQKVCLIFLCVGPLFYVLKQILFDGIKNCYKMFLNFKMKNW